MSYEARADYSAALSMPAGCSDCGGGPGSAGLPANDGQISYRISRQMAPPEISRFSSFGVTWFSESDYSVEFFDGENGSDPTILLFDPMQQSVMEMASESNTNGVTGAITYTHTGLSLIHI